MQITRKKMVYFKYFLIIAILFLGNYACDSKSPLKKAAIKINEYTLTADEFNDLFSRAQVSEDTPKARGIFVANLITRKLLLQEAQREGLDKQSDFLKSIENFWEQSLLKVIVDRKVKEISRHITMTDREIEGYYNELTKQNPDESRTLAELRDTIRWQLLRKKQGAVLDSWVMTLKDKASIKVDKEAIGIE